MIWQCLVCYWQRKYTFFAPGKVATRAGILGRGGSQPNTLLAANNGRATWGNMVQFTWGRNKSYPILISVLTSKRAGAISISINRYWASGRLLALRVVCVPPDIARRPPRSRPISPAARPAVAVSDRSPLVCISILNSRTGFRHSDSAHMGPPGIARRPPGPHPAARRRRKRRASHRPRRGRQIHAQAPD